jgi:secondary thiamine-phosphate synthase enzyme
MKIELEIQSTSKEELIDITDQIAASISKAKIKNGLCLIFAPHTTAGITINENADPDVVRDILYGLDKMVPKTGFLHSEGNSAAHIKSSMVGCSVQIIIQNGHFVLGTWQGIYFCEFDGPRNRQVYIKVIDT